MLNSVIEYLKNSYERYPEKTAVVYNDERLNYREFYINVCKIAEGIKANFMAERKPIIVLMKNSIEALEAFWGIALSNNIYVPVDCEVPQQRLNIIISILEPAGVVICEKSDDYLCESKLPVLQFGDLLNQDYNDEIIQHRLKILDTDPLYILFTSGSTGTPKGVVVSHRAVIDFTEEASETMNFSHEEIFLNQAPFYFDASVPDIFCTVRNGATLHIVDKMMYAFPIKIVDYIEKNKINALFWVPSALIMVANFRVLEKRDLSSLRKIMFCGEVMPAKQLNMWRKVLPNADYVNYYGPSEATYACSYYKIDREFADDEIIPIGRAAINTEILLIDDSGRKVTEFGKIGEIYIRGSGLALGYYNNSEKTYENFVQNPIQSFFPEIVYKTGDLAHYDNNGDIIYDGRIDYQIKHLGYRIELGEIESNTISLENVKQVACVYSEQKDMITCFYSGEIEEELVKRQLKQKLPFYMIPQKFVSMDSLPMNENGKIDRRKLENKA